MQFSIIFSAILLMAKGISGCPDEVGWIPAGDSCYRTSTGHLNWYESQEVSQ